MDQEFNALLHNQTWRLVPPEPHMNIIGCKWVFRTKRTADGSVELYKARLVDKGFNQVAGEDFFDTFSPVVKPTTAPRAWFKRLHDFLLSAGFKSSKTDVSLFYYASGVARVYLLAYVDDIIMMGNDSTLVDTILQRLAFTFKIRDLGSPGFFLGIETVSSTSGMFLSQRRYMIDLLGRSGMVDCKPLTTPAAVTKTSMLSIQLYDNPTQYRRVVGALQYLTITRPDLSFVMNRLCQFMHAPTKEHWGMVKRVLRYVKGTLSYGLRISPSASSDIHAYSDSDWVGCPMDRKSKSGFAVYLGDNLISWLSKKQRTVARSSTEAEYKALAVVSAEVTWVVSLLREQGLHSGKPATLWRDNLGATYLCANPVFHTRTKHAEIDYHFVRDKVASGDFLVNYVSTTDILIKPMPASRFAAMRDKLNVVALQPCA
ncbi:PREDICTED: uncharacterized protein LOC109157783 [Ipomoea nil]|uniref:uncharacterized protein LOC109157783 n=1 Tax=Ipomoea nil TaxID=35883 RepID=UPI0009011F63|nr:PREDICTED: uncharacterized protein LOC109157783 [Ipomoea nil]